MRRAARLGNGWHPLGSNLSFPLGRPEQLAAAIKRLASQTEREGRDPGGIDVVFRVQSYPLTQSGSAETSPAGERVPVSGDAGQVAADIRQYEEMGVTHLVVDFGGVASSALSDPSQVMQRMEDMATLVWPRV